MCLRPVAVWDEAQYSRVRDQWRAQPRSEWEPFWEYGAFVDVRDVAAAVGLALSVPLAGTTGRCCARLISPRRRPASSSPAGSPPACGICSIIGAIARVSSRNRVRRLT